MLCTLLAVAALSASGVRGEIVDLSHHFDNLTHYWYASEHFNLSEVFFKSISPDIYLEAFRFSAQEHGGTHMDAPSHFHKGGWTLEQIPPERFIAHAAVLDISERARRDADAMVRLEDLEAWKREHGEFGYPTVVLARTGYALRWPDRHAYFGTEPDRPEPRHFPGFGPAVAEALADDEAVVGVGIDTPSVDPGISSVFPAHVIMAAKNMYNLEHVADMSRLPENGAIIMAFPMKIAGGSGGPTRVLAQIPSGGLN